MHTREEDFERGFVDVEECGCVSVKARQICSLVYVGLFGVPFDQIPYLHNLILYICAFTPSFHATD